MTTRINGNSGGRPDYSPPDKGAWESKRMLMWEGDKFREITDGEAARYLFMADEPQPKRVTFQDFMKGNPMSEAEKAKAEAPPAAAVEEKKEPAPTPAATQAAKAEFDELLARPLDIGDPLAPILSPKLFAQLQRAAALYSASKFVPETFQNDVASCFIAIELAVRWKLSPVLVMQHLYLVHGKPGLDGQLAIALINSQGPFRGRIQWRFEGEGKTRKVTAYGTLRDTGEICEATVDWNMVEAEGWNRDKPLRDGKGVQKSKWNTMADHIFKFRSAAFLGRTYCPEVLMGLHTIDEVEDITTAAAGLGGQAMGPVADPLAPGKHEKPMAKHGMKRGEFACLTPGPGTIPAESLFVDNGAAGAVIEIPKVEGQSLPPLDMTNGSKAGKPSEAPAGKGDLDLANTVEEIKFRISEGGTLDQKRIQSRMDILCAVLGRAKGELKYELLHMLPPVTQSAVMDAVNEKGWGM